MYQIMMLKGKDFSRTGFLNRFPQNIIRASAKKSNINTKTF